MINTKLQSPNTRFKDVFWLFFSTFPSLSLTHTPPGGGGVVWDLRYLRVFCQILRYLSEKVQDLVDFEIGKMFMLYRTVNKLGANTQCYFQPIPGIRVNFQSKIHFIALSNRIFFACGAFFCLVQSPSAIFIPFQLFGTKVKKSVVLSNSSPGDKQWNPRRTWI